MKNYYLFSLLLLCAFCTAQETSTHFRAEDFAGQVLAYQPSQRAEVTDRDYDFGTMVLRAVVSDTEGNTANFNVADYMNVLSAFLTLDEPAEAVRIAYDHFLSAEGSCEYLRELKRHVVDGTKYLPVREQWLLQAEICSEEIDPKQAISPIRYAEDRDLDVALVQLVANIKEKDQRYRKGGYQAELQRPLDEENERLIDSLFKEYDGYVGNSLVGAFYATTMWAVIQHSRLETMERYLPVLRKAVRDQELPPATLKMLIDRIYSLRHGHQIFGRQMGVKLADKAIRIEVRKDFGLR